MHEFLELITLKDFFQILEENTQLKPKEIEKIDFQKSNNRIVAELIKSPMNLPPFSRSTVDGFAVRSHDTVGISQSLPGYLTVVGEVMMGEDTDIVLNPGEAVKIPTGGMLPKGADAVLMVEYTEYLNLETIEFTSSLAVGENVVNIGEDIKQGEPLLNLGHKIRPQDIGALAGLGITELKVYQKPEVTLISTGDELVSPYHTPTKGEIRDINSYSIGALLTELGCKVRYEGIVEDSYPALSETVRKNLDCDLILISGGSSVGVKDITLEVLNSLGNPGVLVHGISVKPGKPTILAVVNNLPIIGLPGHPASAWNIVTILIKPIIQKIKGEVELGLNSKHLHARLSRNLVSDRGRAEYVPVKVGLESENYLAEPIVGKSSLITTLVQADGYIIIDTFKEGLNQEEWVKVYLF